MPRIITDIKKIDALFSRYTEKVFPSLEEAKMILSSGQKLTFYLGVDPTGSDIHIGHATNLLLLKKIIELGHKAIFLIGDFTAQIGDPTGKDTTRRPLSDKEIKENMGTYVSQASRVLVKGSFETKRNSEWLNKLNFEDLIKISSNFTVQQMIIRDMFQRRIKEEKPIGLHEFLYPLAQGYDSVAMEVDGEVCGDDQTFNALVGRDLSKIMLGKNKIVITTKLLEDPKTGKKIMSKSEGRYISLNDSPKDIFEKMSNSITDEMVKPIFELCTEVDLDKINWDKNPVELKEDLAYELVRMYHGEKSARKTKKEWRKEDEFIGQGMKLSLFISGVHSTSLSSAKDLINQKAVEINGQTVSDWNYEVKKGDLIKIGKRRPVRAV